MGRPVVLSNGRLFAGIDENGLIHDFYWPYVGLENLTTARSDQHKIGVWVDGKFSWTDDGTWEINVNSSNDVLVSSITMRNQGLGVTLELTDFVDVEYDALIRLINVRNESSETQDIRLFMHQVFQISRGGRGDTALYVPDDKYILDYKGQYSLLIAGKFQDGEDFDQFAVGNYALEGKAGTFYDAVDGELSNHPVEHGGVDSVLRFKRSLPPGGSYRVDYWVVAAHSHSDAQVIHSKIKYRPLDERLQNTRQHWVDWNRPHREMLERLPEQYRIPFQKSLLVIKAHCDERGSILASGDSSIFNYGRDYYCYCWPRDGAYAIWPLIRTGHYKEAKKFFEFMRDTMHRDGYLMHKYQPDKAIGSTWHPLVHGRYKELAIQEDETASVLYLLAEYWRISQDKVFIEEMFEEFVKPAATFMIGFIDKETGLPHASYDLWEQKFQTSTYTVCTVIAGLEAAAKMAEDLGKPDEGTLWKSTADSIRNKLVDLISKEGYFAKGLLLEKDGSVQLDDTLDASNFYGPYMFAGLDVKDQRILDTLKAVEERLFNSSPIGGVIRYEHDGYFLAKDQYKGNPWIVCTLWLAQYYIENGQAEKGREILDWAISRALPSGVLSEQYDPENGAPISVTPLVWSHAELVNTILDYSSQN